MIPDPILLSPEPFPLNPDPSHILGFEPRAHIPCYDPELYLALIANKYPKNTCTYFARLIYYNCFFDVLAVIAFALVAACASYAITISYCSRTAEDFK